MQVAVIDSLIGLPAVWQERQAAADLRTGLEEAAGNREDLRAELDDLRAAAAAAEAAPLNMASQLEPPAAASQGIAAAPQKHRCLSMQRCTHCLQHHNVALC